MKKMTFSLDDRVAELLAQMSRETGVPMSRIVRWAVEAWWQQMRDDEP